MVLVDSSVWIEAIRRAGRLDVKVALEGLLEEYEAAWCGPVKLEVLGGARSEDRARLEGWLSCIPYRTMTEAAWNLAKERYWALRDAGQTLPWSDVLIGSLALAWNCRVYAVDRHFEVMRDRIGLRLYQPGYGGRFEPEQGN
ncbi:MAG: PIN domain-containing protein [Verrucomicrobiae bacterium]|nr:PIN domain-containing protein [Verrucomicrobiae bacterium]